MFEPVINHWVKNGVRSVS